MGMVAPLESSKMSEQTYNYAWERIVADLLKRRDTQLATILTILEYRQKAIQEELAEQWGSPREAPDLVTMMGDTNARALYREQEEIAAHLAALRDKMPKCPLQRGQVVKMPDGLWKVTRFCEEPNQDIVVLESVKPKRLFSIFAPASWVEVIAKPAKDPES